MDKIKIEELTVFGKHGVYPEENVLGQKFEVSLVLYTDTRNAGITDDLECSINYGDVCHYVKQFFEENTLRFLLSQADGTAILEGVMGYYDGVGVSSVASSYAVAKAAGAPAILVVNARAHATPFSPPCPAFWGCTPTAASGA